MCLRHLRRVSADDATTFGWVNSISAFLHILMSAMTPYTRRENRLATEVKNVVNAVQWENTLPGDKPDSGKPSSASCDAWLFPKRYWSAPEPPPLW